MEQTSQIVKQVGLLVFAIHFIEKHDPRHHIRSFHFQPDIVCL